MRAQIASGVAQCLAVRLERRDGALGLRDSLSCEASFICGIRCARSRPVAPRDSAARSRESCAATQDVTLLLQIGPPPIKFGRRSVWDVVELDRWLEDGQSLWASL
jgi:hypothetical protein